MLFVMLPHAPTSSSTMPRQKMRSDRRAHKSDDSQTLKTNPERRRFGHNLYQYHPTRTGNIPPHTPNSCMRIYIMLSPANSHIPRWITHTSVLLSIWSALVAARHAATEQTLPLKQTDKNVARAAQPQPNEEKNNRSRSCGVHINSCVCV